MDKVLILGINGFTGRHFQGYVNNRALSEEYSFIGIDKKIEKISDKIKYVEMDLLKVGCLKSALMKIKPQYIVNLAGVLKVNDYNELMRINVELPRQLLEVAAKGEMRLKKLLLIGSAAEYGKPRTLPIGESHPLNPLNYYGFSKVIQGQYASYYHNNYGVRVNIARTFNVLGEGMSTSLSIGSFISQIRNIRDNGSIYVGNLNTKRDFLYIEDVVDAYWKILIHGRPGEVYNVCSGSSLKIKKILNDLIKQSGKRINTVINKSRISEKDISDIYGNNGKLMRHTSWKPKNDICSVIGLITSGG